MTLEHGYCTTDELRLAMGRADTETADELALESAIDAASRWIERHCRTRFWTTEAEEARTYTALSDAVVYTDDLVSLSALATDRDGDYTYADTWALKDYLLEPANAAFTGRPYWAIRRTVNASYRFPRHPEAVRVTGQFGYSAEPPEDVVHACIRRAAQLFRTSGASGSAVGGGEYGVMQALPAPDSMVLFLLQEIRNERRYRPR